MNFKAFKVSEEVADRIGKGSNTTGFMKAYISKDSDKLVFWDLKYLQSYANTTGCSRLLFLFIVDVFWEKTLESDPIGNNSSAITHVY